MPHSDAREVSEGETGEWSG